MRCLVIAWIFTICECVFGQTGASIEIRVVAADGLGVSNAGIHLWPLNLSRKSDFQGRAEFTNLSEGSYRVEITTEGYIAQDTNIYLQAGENRLVVFHVQRPAAILPEIVVEIKNSGLLSQAFFRKDIRASGARNLPDFLSGALGLEIVSDGTQQSIRIGGSQANQVLVLIDGRRLQTTGTGEADLSHVPLEWIESVQIYRGGRTELGHEAIGGIVSITTRQESGKNESSASLEIRPSTRQAGFIRAGTAGRVFSFISFLRTQGPGDYEYQICRDDGTDEFTTNLGRTFRRKNADIVRDQVLVKIRTRWRESNSFEASAWLDRASRGMPGYLAPQLTPLARQKTGQEVLNIKYLRELSSLLFTSRVSYQHDARDYDNPDVSSILKNSHEDCLQWELESSSALQFDKLSATMGTHLLREELTNTQIQNGEARRDRFSVWTNAGWSLFPKQTDKFGLTINSGLRWESFNRSQRLLPKTGLSFTHSGNPDLSGELTWGQSFRAPSLYSLFWMDDLTAQGNPDLLPEKSSEWTARLISRVPTLHTQMELTVSDQWIENLIYWRRTYDNRWKPFNLKQSHVRTLDIGIEQSLFRDALRVVSGLNWTEARDATSDRNTGGKYLTYRAPRTQRVSVSFRLKKWEVSGRMRWISARPALETNSKWLSNYCMGDARLSYRFVAGRVHIIPTLGVDNILNESYRIIRFAPMPLREWYASLSITDW